MPTCRQCNASFPIIMIIDGKRRNLCNRKFCLDCSPFGAHNTSTKVEHDGACVCTKCDRKFTFDRKKGHRRAICNTCLVNSRRPIAKKWAVTFKGGSCLICSYSKCMSALDFHHLDPAAKEQEISDMYLASRSRLQAELEKCVLLCNRCHSEVHENLITTSELEIKEYLRLSLNNLKHAA